MKSSSGGAGSTVVVRRWRGSRRARNSGLERSRGVNIGIGKTGAYAVNTGTAGTETGTDTQMGGTARLITAVDTSCAGWRRGMKRGESCWGTWLSGVGRGDEGRRLVEAKARRRDPTRQSQTGLTKSRPQFPVLNLTVRPTTAPKPRQRKDKFMDYPRVGLEESRWTIARIEARRSPSAGGDVLESCGVCCGRIPCVRPTFQNEAS